MVSSNTFGLSVHDNVAAKDGTIVFIWPPPFQPASPGAAAYGAAPTLAQTPCLVRYDDLTFGIQTLNNLTPK